MAYNDRIGLREAILLRYDASFMMVRVQPR